MKKLSKNYNITYYILVVWLIISGLAFKDLSSILPLIMIGGLIILPIYFVFSKDIYIDNSTIIIKNHLHTFNKINLLEDGIELKAFEIKKNKFISYNLLSIEIVNKEENITVICKNPEKIIAEILSLDSNIRGDK